MAALADTPTTIWLAWQRISELVARGINIAGIAQILHLQHRNSELESDNSDLESENARLRSEEQDHQEADAEPMTVCPDGLGKGGAAQKGVRVGLTPARSPLAQLRKHFAFPRRSRLSERH